MQRTVDQVIKRCKKAWDDKGTFGSLYDDAYNYALPNRNPFSGQSNGSERQAQLYDNTLQQATIDLASMMQSVFAKPGTKWAMLKPGPLIQKGSQQYVQSYEQLRYINDLIFSGIMNSNFDSAMGEFLLDFLFGTGVMLPMDGGDRKHLAFVTIPLNEVALEEGPFSDIAGVYRNFTKSCGSIKAMWPDMKKPTNWDSYSKLNPDKKIKLLEATYFDYEEDMYKYDVLMLNYEGHHTTTAGTFIVRRSYKIQPFIVTRWIKASGEVWGRGPILFNLPTAKTANKSKEIELRSASINAAGVYTVRNNGVLNPSNIKVEPGAFIPVMSNGGTMGPDIKSLEFGGNYQFTQLVQRDLQQSIRDGMYSRGLPEYGTVRSATEWIMRAQDLQEKIGAPAGRLDQEFLKPLFRKILDIYNKKGLIDFDINLIDQGIVSVEIVGPLGKAQAMDDIEAIMNWSSSAQQVLGPEKYNARIKSEEVVRELTDKFNVNPDFVKTEEEIEMEMAEQMQAQAQAQGVAEGVQVGV